MLTEIIITRYNITALIGWIGLILGIIGGILQCYYIPSSSGLLFLAIGLVGGGITITCSGPLKIITKRMIVLQPTDLNK